MKVRKKTCACCGRGYRPNPRTVKTQKTCGRKICRRTLERRRYQSWAMRHPVTPKEAAARRAKVRAWAKIYPDYWRQYRLSCPAYRERERRRMRAKRREARRVAKQTAIREIAVEKLQRIRSEGPQTVAKQTAIARRVEAIVDYLIWKEGVAKHRDIALGAGLGR